MRADEAVVPVRCSKADRATGSTVDQRLTELIGTEGPLAVTEPVAMEVLSGARSDDRKADLRRMIVAVVWRCGAAVLAFDADLIRVARVIRIDLDEASLLA